MSKYIPLVGDFDPEEIEQHRREWDEAEERRVENARISRDATLRRQEKLAQQRAALKAEADAEKAAKAAAKVAAKEDLLTPEGRLAAFHAREKRLLENPPLTREQRKVKADAREAAKTAALARLLGAESALKAFYEAGRAARDPLASVRLRASLEGELKDARREWRRYASHKAGGE